MAGAQVHVARIELGEVGDEEGRGATLASGEVLDARDELGIGEPPEGREKVVPHACLYHRVVRGRVRNGLEKSGASAVAHRVKGVPTGCAIPLARSEPWAGRARHQGVPGT